MKDKPTTAIVIVALVPLLFPSPARGADTPSADAQAYWPQWRGPRGTGVAPHGDPPVEWSDTKNVKWKTAIPGKGHASPVVWGDTIFVQTAVATDRRGRPAGEGGGGRGRSHRGRGPPSVGTDRVHRFTVLAVDRRDGRIRWQRVVREEMPRERTHADGSWASGSPVTDGERVYAYFGSYGLYCLDVKGTLKWQKSLGRMQKRMSFGEGSSPALHGDRIAVLQDHEGPSFIVVLDKTTGREVWRAERDEVSSWSSPLIVDVGGRAQVIASATPAVRSYDLRNGKLLWKCTGLTLNVIPTPVYADDMVFVMSGFRGNALRAIRLSKARGTIDDTAAVAWSLDQHTPYAPSPVLHKGLIHFLDRNGAVLSCYEARTGKEHYAGRRFPDVGTVYASLTAAAGRVYLVGKKGTTLVIRHGPDCELLARNTLSDSFTASPAIVGREIILRGHRNLYCIAVE